MNMTTRLLTSLLCLAAMPALGAGHPPTIEAFEDVQAPQPMANCGDFLIIVEGIGSNRLTTYYDAGGAPVRVSFHGIYNGTMTNSATGKVLTDTPSVIRTTIDLLAGTQTTVGAAWTVTVPGEGVVLVEAGRLVFAGNGPPVFIAGPHLPPPETIATLCRALR